MSSEATSIDSELDERSLVLNPNKEELIRIIILGLIAGAAIPLLSLALGNFFIQPVFCSSDSNPGFCGDISSTAYYISSTLLAFVSVVVLANWQIFRPLIIAIASIASLWGLNRYIGDIIDHNTFEYYILSMGLYLSSYVMFYWAMRIRNFTVSLLISILLITAIRFVLVN